jgi:(2Fe-2S) ferredoxin
MSPIVGTRTVKPSWKRGLVLVCRACDGDAKGLRRGLKTAFAEAGLQKRVRVVASGCLDVCPKRANTVVTVGEGVLDCSIVRDADPQTLRSIVGRFESAARDE